MRNKTLGILGGGQLGRMSALAAACLGIDTVIFCPEKNNPASRVSTSFINAEYDDQETLKYFADQVDFITYEFENIPIETVRYLNKHKPVFPDEKLLEVSQDRISEKSFLNEIGIDTTRWKKFKSSESLEQTFTEWNCSTLILKTARFGYDGKGQIKINKGDNINDAIRILNGDIIIEDKVDFQYEISVICARDKEKNMVVYGPMLNEHKDHILHKTTIPAALPKDIADKSISMVKTLAEKIDLRGILTLELFVTKGGELLANEIAPRTHNSGHWSMDACAHSQFDQHIRAVCGLPVIEPYRHSDVTMLNLIGEDINLVQNYLDRPEAVTHDYGKNEVREGRKMGHINILSPKS
ncbi:MAG: 5-(carboxyamino)imidazole ribonucleotide synthase [Alphaproteobacteria bacterium]